MKNQRFQLDYDVRVVDRNIREGDLTKEEYEKYLESLPDVESKGEWLQIETETRAETAATVPSEDTEPEEGE